MSPIGKNFQAKVWLKSLPQSTKFWQAGCIFIVKQDDPVCGPTTAVVRGTTLVVWDVAASGR